MGSVSILLASSGMLPDDLRADASQELRSLALEIMSVLAGLLATASQSEQNARAS